jgi:DNA-binding YbaB/EbfC family protein
MKNRNIGMPGNMNEIMRQAQKMQKDMQKLQAEAEAKEFEVTAGGGAVKVVVNGKKELIKIELSESIVDKDDIEMLQDLIMAAVNEANRTADEAIGKEMSKVGGGLNIPGLF